MSGTESMLATAVSHAIGDAACGRPWQCACATCKLAREYADKVRPPPSYYARVRHAYTALEIIQAGPGRLEPMSTCRHKHATALAAVQCSWAPRMGGRYAVWMHDAGKRGWRELTAPEAKQLARMIDTAGKLRRSP